ncbi:MAG: cupin domain-containing protein [Calditrichaeota bacterium]|nr:MAG: cupin domain-containing protein [Calditrichota bacterium]MBL1204805.1 cupin domain-containing protein [Calditrichota bacterium]NOG44634.1 cupin domain-containing protein [Calditrichota bacterium]
MSRSAESWIKELGLIKHPEGGWFKETYRSSEIVLTESLPDRFTGDRSFSTAIYFLLTSSEFSAFHRIKQDEIWHFYDGSSLTIHVIDPNGKYFTLNLGKEISEKESLQIVVKSGWLFGATVNLEESFSLVGCTVSPGFDFDDFKMPDREELSMQFPQHQDIIRKLTRDK